MSKEVEDLKALHYTCRDYLDKKNYVEFTKFLSTKNNNKTNINEIKMILIVTQQFTQEPTLKNILQELQNLFIKLQGI